MASADEANTNNPPLWQMTSLADYALPPAPAREAATKSLAALWRLIRSRNQPQQPPEKTEDQLQSFSDEELARLVPAIDWTPGVAALDIKLAEWIGNHQRSPVRFFIGPPYTGHADMLDGWARQRGLTTIAPPTPEQILTQDPFWFSSQPFDAQIWVLPDLERCFLRHAEGLAIVRRFLEQALSGRLGCGLVGCDSWAWSYLQKMWPVPLTDFFTLQAFDGERLKRYFSALVATDTLEGLCFREVNNGRDVLQTKTQEAADASSTSLFFKHLAVQSRGNLGVACAYWRASLSSGSDALQESDAAADTDCRHTIWLRTGLKEPELPLEPTSIIAFVLHALLLHNGLTADLLETLLPFSRYMVSATLLHLASVGVVEEDGPVWRISALGYPVVRQFLKSNGYLIDSF